MNPTLRSISYLLLVVLFFVSAWLLLQEYEYFKVKMVTINGKLITEKQKAIILSHDQYKNLYNINLNELKRRIWSIYSTKKIQITKKYPDTLAIEILENYFIAFLKIFDPISENSTIFGMNNKGQLINRLTLQNEKKKIIL